MKKLILFIFLSAAGIAGAKSQGIVFETGTVAEIMAKAAAQNKLVFVDVYTDWCGPCKKMANDIFPRERIGESFNSNFINCKIDAEKGEGIEFAEKYAVTSFPTMLFIDPTTGAVIHRIVGTKDEQGLLNEVGMIGKSAKYGGLDKMRADFGEGANDPGFLLAFHELLTEEDPYRGAVALTYLKNLPDETLFDQVDEMNMTRLEGMITEIPFFDGDFFYRFADGVAAVMDSGVEITPEYSLAVIFAVLQKTGNFIRQAIDDGDETYFEELLRYKEYWPTGAARIADHDVELIYGRTLFFASCDFLRLEYCRANELEERFRVAMPVYMDRLMARYPKGTFKSDYFDIGLMVDVIKSNPDYKPLFFHDIFKHMGRSVDMFTQYVKYYWNISPNDEATKSLVSKWVDYVVSMNPYHTDGICNLVPLLVRVGHKKDAVGLLDRTISLLEEFGQREAKRVHEIGNLRKLVENDKI